MNTILRKHDHQHLATLIHEASLKKQIEEEIKSKYLKRIDYLIGANNELFHELERCEEERDRFASIADSILLGRTDT